MNFKFRWNCHRIRPNRIGGCPPGVPNDLYLLPNITGKQSSAMALHSCVTAQLSIASMNSQTHKDTDSLYRDLSCDIEIWQVIRRVTMI